MFYTSCVAVFYISCVVFSGFRIFVVFYMSGVVFSCFVLCLACLVCCMSCVLHALLCVLNLALYFQLVLWFALMGHRSDRFL